METKPIIDRKVIAEDFAARAAGKLEPEKIDSAVKTLLAATTTYPATGSVASFIFYLKFQVQVKNGGKTFDGNAGGLTTPGGGALIGDVYTDDINALYANTASFEFNATSVYTSLLYFDKNHNLLGHFQAGSVSTVNGIGGGSGAWS
jgi:hypothetical protein